MLTRTEVPPLVLTCAAAAGDARARLGSAAEVIDCSADDPGQVDLAAALAALAERGLPRVLSRAGRACWAPSWPAGLLDEMCLTTAPVLVGGVGAAHHRGTGPRC